MKALSIRQPWADLILLHGKDVENRTWAPPWSMKGQRIYVHAGKLLDKDAYDLVGLPAEPPVVPPERLGAILGEVTLVKWVRAHASPWFGGPWGWLLADPVSYPEPIPCRGHLGLFTPDIRRPT